MKKWMFSILMCSFSLNTVAAPVAWPKTEWPRRSITDSGLSKPHFDYLVRVAFARHLTFSTDSLVVIKDGHLIYEGHANGYKRDQRHTLFSLGKTILNALAGVVEYQGLAHRNDQVSRHYPALNQYGVKNITIKQLLNMSSGLQWIEEDRENLLQSDPWFALYSRDSYKDMAAWVTKRSVLFQGETKFNYSSGDSALLIATLRGAIGERAYPTYAWDHLFKPLGMNNVAIEHDEAGNQGLHAISFASPLDIARLGLLFLRDGVVDGRRLWPRDWVRFTKQMAPAQNNPFDPNDRNVQNNQAYGAHIWLNVRRPGDATRPYPELPANALIGVGTRGQILLLLPDEDLILVRTGTDTEISVQARKDYRHDLFRALAASLRAGGRP